MPPNPPIYVLNLSRHTKRLESMRTQLKKQNLNWERFPAIDANYASEKELFEFTDPKGPIPRMGAGARACTCGHFKIWLHFLSTNAPVAFILEDDAILSKEFSNFITESERHVSQIEILNFNRQNSKGLHKKLVVSKKNVLSTSIFTAQKLLAPHYGTAGYMITRNAASILINNIKRTNMPIDHLLFNPNISKFSKNFNVYQSFPAFSEPNIQTFNTSIQDEMIPESFSLLNKIKRSYHEIRQVPLLIFQLLIKIAEIKILQFLP